MKKQETENGLTRITSSANRGRDRHAAPSPSPSAASGDGHTCNHGTLPESRYSSVRSGIFVVTQQRRFEPRRGGITGNMSPRWGWGFLMGWFSTKIPLLTELRQRANLTLHQSALIREIRVTPFLPFHWMQRHVAPTSALTPPQTAVKSFLNPFGYPVRP